jgi:two-component system, sensor histidine kinase and response regulator
MIASLARSGASPAESLPSLLVVDHHSRDDLTRVVAGHFDVHWAEDEYSALHILQTSTIDAVLLGSIETTTASLEILDAIRRQPTSRDLPVILYANSSDESFLIEGFARGASDYLPYPLHDGLALARIEAQVTLKRRLDEQQQTIRRLRTAQRNHGRMLRMIAHDLKTPLSNVSLGENLLRHYTSVCTDMGPVLDGMSAAIDTMRDVLDDFSSAAAVHDISIRLAAIPVERVIYDVALQYSAAASSKDILLTVEDAPGWVLADNNRLNQIVGNLVSNAVKYSPPGTTVRVGASRHEHAIRISVADEGPGIREDERELLFTEFGRGSNLPTGGEASTGLGLWIVRRLTEAMGGHAGVDFPETGGAVFWVDLPETVPLRP